MKSKTITMTLSASPQKVYDFVSHLENLPKWATTFCQSIKPAKEGWLSQSPQGEVLIRMTEKNNFGVLDHTVIPEPGVEIKVPMRVIPNGAGCEILFTLFQYPHLSDAQFAQDIEFVQKDLNSLKQVLEALK